MLYNRFIQPKRKGDLDLHTQIRREIIPCFFAFDHSKYASWLPDHVRDLMKLNIQHTDLYEEFKKGYLVVQREMLATH